MKVTHGMFLCDTYEYVWADGKLVSIISYVEGQTYTAKYLYNDLDEPIGMVYTDESGSAGTYYYLKNAQGDITCILNSFDEKIVSFSYDAFGKITEKYHTKNSILTPLGMVELVLLQAIRRFTPFGYRGYCYDTFTGLYYLQSRYYDPNVGRFINADDTNYLNATGTVLGCNLFAYCENDPVNRVDPEGNLSVGFSMIIGAILGVLGLYIMDILFNLAEGRLKWYKTYSTKIDYISAAVSGAISMLSIKKLSAILSASVSGITYIINQWNAGKKISLSSLIITVGIAIVMDIAFPGDGIDLSKRVGIIKTAKQKLKTLVSKNKIKQYANKIKNNISAIIKNAFYTLLSNTISYTSERMEIVKSVKNLGAYLRKVLIL